MKTNYSWQDKRGFGPLAILLVIAVVVVLGGGAYYASHHSTPYVAQNTESSSSASADVSLNTSGSLKGLLALGRDLTCTFSSATTSGSATGTIYLTGPMMRGDFTTTSQSGSSVQSHMIRNGDVAYAWSGSQGAKMSFSDITSSDAQARSNVNLDQKVDYKCSPWTPDNGKFTLPTSVTFTDITAMMHGAMQASSTGSSVGAGADLCTSVCAHMSGNPKTQCMAAYNCK